MVPLVGVALKYTCYTFFMGTEKLFCISINVQVLPLGVTRTRDSDAWNYRGLAILFTLNESLASDGFEPLIIGSMREKLTIELS